MPKDPKKKMVLDTINFLIKQKNIALFRLSDANEAIRIGKILQDVAKQDIKLFDNRIKQEVITNIDLFKKFKPKSDNDGVDNWKI